MVEGRSLRLTVLHRTLSNWVIGVLFVALWVGLLLHNLLLLDHVLLEVSCSKVFVGKEVQV